MAGRIANPAQHIVQRFQQPKYIQALTPNQKRVYNDPARFKRSVAGRQSGKSHAWLTWLLGGGAGQTSLVFARTWEQVKGIYLEPAYELNEKYGLGLHISESQGEIVERSGHVIKLTGIRDMASAEKFRGRRFRRVVGDETQTYTDELIRWIVLKVLQPTLLKHNGSMGLAGTPGQVPEGFWHEICEGSNAWPINFSKPWTLYDNPFLPDVEGFIADILKTNNWTREEPTFLREYLCRWVRDSGGMIYDWKGAFEPAPATGTTVLGVDMGYDDGCGYVVCRMTERPHVYVLRAFSATQTLPHEIYHTIKGLCERYNVNHVIADTGASKTTIEQLNQQFGLNIIAAKTTGEQGKRANIDMTRGMLKVGNLHLCGPSSQDEGALEMRNEWSVLPWNLERSDHMTGYQDELSDALIYALKLFLQRPGESEGQAPDPIQLEIERRRRSAMKHAEKNRRQKWRAERGLWVPSDLELDRAA